MKKNIKVSAPKNSGCDTCKKTNPAAFVAQFNIYGDNDESTNLEPIICEDCLRKALSLIEAKRNKAKLKERIKHYNELNVDPISKEQLKKVKESEAAGWTHCQWDGADDPRQHAWFLKYAEATPYTFENLPPLKKT